MAYIWTKDLETGNELIDSQHKELIRAVNNLINACLKGKGRDEVNKTMKFLTNYTERHFADEEKLQVQNHYPYYLQHRRHHQNFKLVVQKLDDQLQKEGPSPEFVKKVNSQIGDWLVNHIRGGDADVAKFIKDKS